MPIVRYEEIFLTETIKQIRNVRIIISDDSINSMFNKIPTLERDCIQFISTDTSGVWNDPVFIFSEIFESPTMEKDS